MPTFIIQTDGDAKWISNVLHSDNLVSRALVINPAFGRSPTTSVKHLLTTPTHSNGETVDSFDVWVSVSTDDHTEISQAFLDEAHATAYAKAKGEVVRHFISRKTRRAARETRYETYFITLDDDNREGEICHFHRTAQTRYEPDSKYLKEKVRPYITRRRRYSGSLPYRYEVNIPDHLRLSHGEANNFVEMLLDRYVHDDVARTLQFNVDYELVEKGEGRRREWVIDPKLLTNCQDTPE